MDLHSKNQGQRPSSLRLALSGRKQREQFIANIIRDGEIGSGPPCRFTPKEVNQLLKSFKELAGPSMKVSRATFRIQLHKTFHITDDFLMDRIFRTFDHDNDGSIRIDEYIWGMSNFVRGTKEDRIKFCFLCYDHNWDGHISRDEMFTLLKNSLVRAVMDSTDEDPEESCREMVDMLFKKLDVNHDGRVDLPDFKEAVYSDFLLMESLGQCLPLRDEAEAFIAYLNQ